MDIRKRKNSNEKAKIALEALKNDQPLSKIALKNGVHPNQITKWKKKLIEHAAMVFNDNTSNDKREQELENFQDELYKEIGKLKIENEFLKKKLKQMDI